MLSLLALALAATPAQSCLANAPALGTDPATAFPQAVDGATIKNFRALDKLRKSRGDQLLVIKGGDLSGQAVKKAQLYNICFIGTKLANTNWRGAQTAGLGFIRSDLAGAQLAGASFERVLLREATMSDVDATGASFAGGRLDGGWGGSLARLKLDNARMTGFQVVCGTQEVDGCPFDRAGMSIRGADFTNANLASFNFWNTTLDGAILDNTHVGVQQIGQLRGLIVRGPIVIHSPRRRVTLSPQDYQQVRQGVTLIVPAQQAEKPRTVDLEACAAISDRLARAVCSGGAPLQDLAQQVTQAARQPAVAAELAAAQEFCVNLSDDMVPGCLRRAYQSVMLRRAPSVEAAPIAGALSESAVFAALPMRFSDGFRRSPIYTRVLPVLLDVAPTQIYATVGSNGALSLAGGSQSGCRVAASNLYYSRQSGWYEAASGPVRRWKGRIIRPRSAPVVRFGPAGPEFDATARGQVVTCAGSGKLDPTVRISAPPAFIALLSEEVGGRQP